MGYISRLTTLNQEYLQYNFERKMNTKSHLAPISVSLGILTSPTLMNVHDKRGVQIGPPK